MPDPYLAPNTPYLKPGHFAEPDNPQPDDGHTQAIEGLLEAADAVALIIGRSRTAILLHQAGDALG